MQGFFSSSKVQKDAPDSGMVAKCGACGLFKHCESPKMPVYGDGGRRVMIVGDFPGETEQESNRPFMGKGGSFLRQALGELNVDIREDAWSTNALICRTAKSLAPDAKQIEWCRPNLLNSIRELSPRVIITLGRSALVSVLKGSWGEVGPLERWTGWQIPLERHWVCPTFHPNFLLRMTNPLMDRLFGEHLAAAFAIDQAPPKQDDFSQLVEIIFDDEKAAFLIREMDQEGGWVAVDYESNCLKPEYPKAKIYSCALSNGSQTISFPWVGEVIPAMGEFFRSKRTRKIASNMKFEERWTLKNFGHGVRNWGWDTMLAAHCLDNRQGICSVKFQALVKMGVPIYNTAVEPYLSSEGHYNRIHEIDPPTLLLYGGMDALLEYRLAMIQRREMGYED